MNKKDISYILKVAKRCDLSGDYVLADKFSKLLEKNYRYSQANELTMDNFVDRLFQFVANSGLRDANGNVSFVDAFNRFSYFGARINNVSISMIPELVNLRNIVGSNPGKVYMPDDLKNMLRGGVSSNSGNANNNNARNNAGNNNQNNNQNNNL